MIINPFAFGVTISGLILDLDAQTLSLADNDPVSTWPDQSGGGNDATASGTTRPTYKATAGPGSLPCVNFDGSDDLMTLTSNITSSPVSMFVVAKAGSLADRAFICGAVPGGLEYRHNPAGKHELLKANTSGIGLSSTTGAISTTVFKQIATTWDGTNWAFYDAGTAAGSGSNATSTTAMTTIGGRPGNSEMFNGSLCEIKVYSRVLTSGEITTVVSQLASHWGI